MKFTIERTTFIKALAHITAIVERRNTIPILSNVLIRADGDDDWLTLAATDLDIEVKETILASIHTKGAITVSAQLLSDIVKKLPEGSNINVELKDGKLIVKAGRSRFQLPTIPADDFPVFPFKASHAFSVSGHDLTTAIDKTRFAMSIEETRYYLQGLFWHSNDGLTIAATDGHRLATHNLSVDYDGPDMIVPRKAINEVRKIIAGGDITIQTGDNKIQFQIDNVTLTAKLIDGTFPDYQRVIPKANPHTLNIDPLALKAAIERVAIVSGEKTKGVKVTLSGQVCTVSVTSPENGTASEEIPCEFDGTNLEIGFNSLYLRDVLGAIDDGCVIKLDGPGSPALLNERFVVMPMRI
jgi:DNA polymerase-3 subunit beta